MKKMYFLIAFSLIAMTACQQNPAPVPVDREAEKTAIGGMLDALYSAVNDKDVDALASLFTEDLLFCGSDPSEFWTREEIVDQWAQMFDQMDSSQVVKIEMISDREIRLSADGTTAIVVEQYVWPLFTPGIPWRNVYEVIKDQDQWLIHFVSSALIPKNEDLPKLNMAMMEE